MIPFFTIILAIIACYAIYTLIHALINHNREFHEIESKRKYFEEKEKDLKESNLQLAKERKQFEKEMELLRKAFEKDLQEKQKKFYKDKQQIETNLTRQIDEFWKDKESYENELANWQADVISKKEFYEKEINNIENVVKEKCDIYPQFAAVMADYLTLHYDRAAKFLKNKQHPALTEAIRIKALRAETQKILAEKKLLEYRYNYILKLYPNMEDIFDKGFNEEAFVPETEDDTDRTRLYLTHDEYSKLSVTERNQLALDRYIEQRKSNWQIGRDYEMYIGYKCESLGYHVEYNGILEKLEDMGRDLIVSKDLVTYIIQCKNWSQEKMIHEKHIFQLYGTYVLYKMDHPLISCYAVFVTTTSLSKKALKIANYLNIIVLENIKPNIFPRIKCNISRRSGEKIYHLPFDQQYDKTVIETSKGEFYALTVAEAEDKGFRRAFKYFGVD